MKPVRRYGSIALLFLYFILLTGCTKLEMNFIIEENGTVEATYILSMQQLAEAPIDTNQVMDAAQAQAIENGFTTLPYSKDGFIGFEAKKIIEGNELKGAGPELLGFNELPSIFTDFFWVYTPGIFENNYQMKLNMNLRNIIDMKALDTLPSDMKELALEAIEQGIVEVNFTLPGKSFETNAQEVHTLAAKKSTRYTWRLKPGQTSSLQINAILEKNETRNFIYILTIIASILIILVISALIIRNRRKKNNKTF